MDSLTCVFGTNTGQQHKIIFKVANLKIEQNTIYIYIYLWENLQGKNKSSLQGKKRGYENGRILR